MKSTHGDVDEGILAHPLNCLLTMLVADYTQSASLARSANLPCSPTHLLIIASAHARRFHSVPTRSASLSLSSNLLQTKDPLDSTQSSSSGLR